MWNIVIWTSTVQRTFVVGRIDPPALYAALEEVSRASGEAPIMFGDRVDEPSPGGGDPKWRSI